MKTFTAKAIATAAGMVCAGVAFAGSISSPATDAAATKYAIEALKNTTDLTAPNIVYTMGVPRTVNQDFTVIVTPSAGASFTAGSCGAAAPVMGGTGTAVVSLKRSSTSECAWEVDITADSVVGDTLTFAGLVFDTHTLAAAGNNASVTLALKDLGETAYIDNSGSLTRRVASSVQSVNIYGATSDTATIADVNAAGGPLTGFVANATAPLDTPSVAAANLTFDNNLIGAMGPDGVTPFDFTATTGTAALTLTGSTSGAATDGFCINLNNDANVCEASEIFTLSNGSTATRAAIASTSFPAQGTTDTRRVSFEADGTTQLGTARTFAVSGTITPEIGAANSLADTAGKNSTWWVWSANASQLMTSYFTTNGMYNTRFFLLNTGASAVGYNATCYAESGNAITYQPGRTGTLTAKGLTTIDARNVCTFDNLTRGSVVFTINAPIDTVKGTYQFIDQATLNGNAIPMVRPYDQAKTTE